MKHLIALGGSVGAAVSLGVVLAITLPIIGVRESFHQVITAVVTIVAAAVVYRAIIVAFEEPPPPESGPDA